MSEPAVLAPTGANRCKGLGFDSTLEFMRAAFGEDIANQIREALPAPLRDSMTRGALVKGGWYPLAWYDALHVAAQQVTGRGPDLSREIGRETTQHDLAHGVYRVFLKILWPDLVIQKAPLIFNRYFEQGEMSVTTSEAEPFATDRRKTVTASWKGCSGFTENTWQDVIGGCEGALLAAGARDIVVELVSGGRDRSPACIARATYR